MSRRRADERMSRLLVMLPWLMGREVVPIDEVARRFDLSREEVVADLELAAMCGLPPFVDELIDIFIDDDEVHIGVPRLFTRPLRLTPLETLEVLVAIRAASGLPGVEPGDPLLRVADKLSTLLDVDDAVIVDLDGPEMAVDLRSAVEAAELIELSYWSQRREALIERLVLPRRVFADRGFWYLMAVEVDPLSDTPVSGPADTATGTTAVEYFRVDRIVDLRPTGRHLDPPAGPLPEPGRWFESEELPRVTVRIDPTLRWMIDQFPVDSLTTLDDGRLDIVLAVASRQWLERLMVRLGPGAEILGPAEYAEVADRFAASILARYADDRPSDRSNGAP